MSSFANQGGQLRGSLIEAGLPAAAATILANILANGVQPLRHSGEITHDTTPQSLRQVTPEARTHSLKNLDFRDDDPDFRRQVIQDDEGRPKPVPNSTVVTTRSPQESASSLSNTSPGSFTDVSPSGDSSTVSLRIRGGGDFPVLDHATNTIIGKNIRTESDGMVRLQVENRAEEIVFKAGIVGGAGRGAAQIIPVVTGVSYRPFEGLSFYYTNIWAWVIEEGAEFNIPVRECVTE